MTYKILGIITVLSILLFPKCTEIDDEAPKIDFSQAGSFPQACDTIYRGESFIFHAGLSDDTELGAFSIDLHNNFDHHTHSTDVIECEMEPIKSPVEPFLFIEEYEIPDGRTEYSATGSIHVPESVDTGDYHFMIRVTDAEGWQSFKGISIKITDR